MNPSIDRRQTPDRRAALREGHSAMSAVDYIAMVLLIVGGLNWGMVGLFGVDVVASLFGTESPVSRVIYTLVGLAAVYSIWLSSKMATSKRP
jgi:uncharacterized membrane protein YuzA (DUF378 family)